MLLFGIKAQGIHDCTVKLTFLKDFVLVNDLNAFKSTPIILADC